MVSFIIPTVSLERRRSLKHILRRPWGLRETVNNISKVVKIPHEIIIVGNSIKDDLAKYIIEEERINKYCINSQNVGVSRAWNIGVMLAEGNSLCFINDDVELGKESVESLIDVLQSDVSIGEVGPAGGKFSGSLGKAGPRVGLEKIEEADEISGFMFIIKRHVFELTGGFDIRYTPAGYEEIDMSFKIRSLGFKCIVVPNIKIEHHNYDGISTKKDATIKYFDKFITTSQLHLRNKEIFIKKWGHKDNNP